jgi:ParB/Sulfiredoxin domain
MTTPSITAALLPDPPLFDVTRLAEAGVDAVVKRFAIEDLETAPNARRHIDSLESLATSLCRNGQLVPLIGHQADHRPAVIYDGQRRLLAARLSRELAGTEGYEHLQPVQSLIVLLLDHKPSPDEIRRLQAVVNNAREALSLVDQQAQFEDCWQARAGLDENDRIAAVYADLGSAPRRRTTCAGSSRYPRRSASASRSAQPATSCPRRREPAGGHARDRPGADQGRRGSGQQQ